MKLAQERLEQRRIDLLNDISARFNAQQNTLLERQKQIEELNEMLNKNITQAKDLTKTGDLRMLKPIIESLKKVNKNIQSSSSDLELGENYLAFDPKKGLDEFDKSLCGLG